MARRSTPKDVGRRDIQHMNCGWPGCHEHYSADQKGPPEGWRMLMVANRTDLVHGLRLSNPKDPTGKVVDLPLGTFISNPEFLNIDRVLCPEHVQALYAMLHGPDRE